MSIDLYGYRFLWVLAMFIDREYELKNLDEMYSMFLKGHSHGVIVYGFRKVGKTTLVRRFIENKRGIWLDLSWVNSVESLARIVATTIERDIEYNREDPVEAIAEILGSIEFHARENNVRIPAALDEFHILVERLPIKLSRKYGLRRDEVFVDLLWKLRGIITSSTHVFWILVSSVGWAKIREYLSERQKAKGALLGVLDKLEVKPLSHKDSVLLATTITKDTNGDVSEEIARLSGGIPRIIEILARRYNTTKEKPLKLATAAIVEGDFDELFDSMIRFLAEFSRRDFDTLLQALKAVAEGNKTPEAAARYLGTTRDSAYNVLEELVKVGLLERKKNKKRIIYELRYPLLREWLLLRIQPQKDKTEILARALGITAESYMRELLEQATEKKITIFEDKEGNTFYGTTSKLTLNIRKVLSKRETERILSATKNADIVAQNDTTYIIEVKITTRKIPKEEVESLQKTVSQLKRKIQGPVRGILAILEGEPTKLAIAEAIKHDIVILSPKAIRILAKKLDYPHW